MNNYQVSHYHNYDDVKDCIVIKTTLELEEFVEIISAIQFKFEEIVAEDLSLEEYDLLFLLKKYYGVTDIKKHYEEFLPAMVVPKEDWGLIKTFAIGDDFIEKIDWYMARESCCGPGFSTMMEKRLPNSQEFLEDVKKLKPRYLKTEEKEC